MATPLLVTALIVRLAPVGMKIRSVPLDAVVKVRKGAPGVLVF